MTDFYAVLEVSRDADSKTIKASYRRLAMSYHPDRNPGDKAVEEKFKAINEAYAVLSDETRRSRYDRYGTVDDNAVFGGDIFDIFASVFGTNVANMSGGRGRAGGQPGEDLEAQLRITLEQAREGATVEVEVERLRACHHCHGERAEPGSAGKSTCQRCGGAGQVRVQAQSIFGAVITARTCPDCHGDGHVIPTPCKVCNGRGRERGKDTVGVTLPKGIDGGYRLRVPREGNVGVDGGQSGDLYLYVEMLQHPFLERAGDDLHYTLEVGMAQAALGATFDVPTLEGRERLTVPAGTQPGSAFRLRGKGMPRLRQTGNGDQVVEVKVVVPTKLTAEAREHLAAYAGAVDETVEEQETVADKVRDFFAGKGKGKRRGRGQARADDQAGGAGDAPGGGGAQGGREEGQATKPDGRGSQASA
jgi:molecular chaperone DnaJ